MTVLFCFLLSGCTTPTQIAQPPPQEAAQYRAWLAGQCSGFGFAQGTPDFAQCMMQLHQAEQQRKAAIGAAIIGSGMLNPRPQPSYQLPMPPPVKQPRQTNCYTDTLGYTRCTTY
jgi:hypothetical protein